MSLGYYRYFHHNVSLWEKVFLAHYEICLQSLALYISIRSICCFCCQAVVLMV